jgi:hypothetical protein
MSHPVRGQSLDVREAATECVRFPLDYELSGVSQRQIAGKTSKMHTVFVDSRLEKELGQ